MNKALKIIFILLAIVILGLGIFFIFFDTDRHLSVYNNLNSAMLYKYNLGLDGNLANLNDYGYCNNEQSFSAGSYNEIYQIRQKLFSSSKLQGGSAESGYLNYFGYSTYETIITEGIQFYSNYTVLASNASKRKANILNSLTSRYKTAIAQIYELAINMKELQSKLDVVDSSVTESSVLDSYNKLRESYRDYLRKGAELLCELRDYVVVESFGGNYNFETLSVLYDSIAETIFVAMSSPMDQEINYLNDASVYVDKYVEYDQNGSIDYGIVGEINYLLAYKRLYDEDRVDYDKLFKFTHFQKYDLVHGTNNIAAQIKVDYLNDATIVVGLLGL